MPRSRKSTTTASVILQITPEIVDFGDIQIWREDHDDAMGPTTAGMKVRASATLSSVVEKINSFIVEEVEKIFQTRQKNIHPDGPPPRLKVDASFTHQINKISFVGTDFLTNGRSRMESFGIETGSSFQVEYVVNCDLHVQMMDVCCVIA